MTQNTFRISLEAKDRKEARAIAEGLKRPDVRAFVAIIGLLEPFSHRARQRMMMFVVDHLRETNGPAAS